MRSVGWVRWVGIAAAAAPVAWAGAPGPVPQDAARTGPQLYRTHCASCHGATGRGDGPLGEYLTVRPANLTGIAARNRGVFPTDVVARIVDGRRVLKIHGDSAMPIWGDVFSMSGNPDADKAAAEKIRAVVSHVESLQQRSGE
jgi:mono/diheme cytochrome c family protein